MVLSHQRRHLQLLRIRHQEAKWHRTSPGAGLCEGSYRRQLPASTRNPAASLAPVSGGVRASLGPGQKAQGDGQGGGRGGVVLIQALSSALSSLPLQSYFQSLRERQLGPGSQATAPHTVLDLDSDCSSTVPLTAPSGSTHPDLSLNLH